MSRIHAGLNSSRFEKPNTVSSYTICAETGKRATTGCPNTYTEYFLWLTAPGLCDKHAGTELQENTNNTTQNKVEEIIQGITQDIDAEDPQQLLPNHTNNSNTQNNTSTQNSNSTNKQTNTTSMNITNTTNHTNSIYNNTNSSTINRMNTTNNTNTSNNTNTNSISNINNQDNMTNNNTTNTTN